MIFSSQGLMSLQNQPTAPDGLQGAVAGRAGDSPSSDQQPGAFLSFLAQALGPDNKNLQNMQSKGLPDDMPGNLKALVSLLQSELNPGNDFPVHGITEDGDTDKELLLNLLSGSPASEEKETEDASILQMLFGVSEKMEKAPETGSVISLEKTDAQQDSALEKMEGGDPGLLMAALSMIARQATVTDQSPQTENTLRGNVRPAGNGAESGKTDQLLQALQSLASGEELPEGENPLQPLQSLKSGEKIVSEKPGLDLRHAGSAESNFRQYLNDLAGRMENNPSTDDGIAEIIAAAQASDTQDSELDGEGIQQVLRPAVAGGNTGRPEVSGESMVNNRPENTPGIEIAQGAQEKAERPAAPVQPAESAFDKHLQSVDQKIVGQVFVRLFTGIRQGSGNMTVNMYPPELGKVKVRLVSEQGSLNVHLHSQNQQVAAILEKHLPMLQQSLADQGIDISDLQVSVDSGGQDNNHQFGEHLFHSRRPGGNATDPANDETVIPVSAGPAAGSQQGLSLRV